MRIIRPLPSPAIRAPSCSTSPIALAIDNPTEQAASLLTEKQAAQFLAVSVRAVQAWRHRGVGPRWVRCGRLVRYRLADIQAWLATNTHQGTTEYSQ
jgi:excisionase family DNA binding protein